MHSLWTYLHQIIKTRLRDFRLAGIFEIFFILLYRYLTPKGVLGESREKSSLD